jgi:uncharacterized protein (TIRG00374 family)
LIRNICLQILKILVSGLLIGLLFHKIGLQKIVYQLSAVHKGWLLAAAVIFTATHILGSYQWWLLLKSECIQISWRRTLTFYLVGLFFNNFFISALGGDLFRMYDIRQYTKDVPKAVSTVFLDRIMGLFVLSGLAVFLAPFTLLRPGNRMQLLFPYFLFVAGWILFFFLFFHKPFARPFAWIVEKLIPKGIAVKFREVYRKIHDFSKQRRLVFSLICLSFIIQSGRITTHYLLAIALGVSVSPITFFVIVPVIAIMASLPISIGGIGLREQTGVVLFGIVGMTSLQAFSIEFLAYLVAIITSIPGGVIFMIRKKVQPEHMQISRKMIKKEGVFE